jgi:thiol:disulfide interchange protein
MNKKITLILITIFLLACNALLPRTTELDPFAPAPTESGVQSTSDSFVTVRLHPKDGDLQTMLAQESQKAAALGLMPVVEFDATWCPPCQAIDEGLKSRNELMLNAYAGTYIIKLNVDEWGWVDGKVQNFHFDGIPVYFKLDAQGQQTGEVIDGNAWGDNIPENIAPPMDKFFHGANR